MKQNLYAVLGVAHDASQETIESAFREKQQTLALEVAQGKSDAESRMRLVIMAHELLSNPAKRKAYEKILQREAESLKIPNGDQPLRQSHSVEERKEEAPPKNLSAKLFDRAIAILQGKVSLSKALLFGVLLPFIFSSFVAAFTNQQLSVLAFSSVWYLVASYIIMRSATTLKSGAARWATYLSAGLMAIWNVAALGGIALTSKPGKAPLSILAHQGTDSGCQSPLTNVLLDALIPPKASAIQQDAEFVKTNEGRLLDAALNGQIEVAKSLLDQGVNVNVQDKRRQYFGNNAMHHAARTNNIELAKFLMGRGMNVDEPGPTGYSALHVASGLGNLQMVEFLLAQGANLGQLDQRSGSTPLGIAIVQGTHRTVSVLLKNDAMNMGGAGKTSPLVTMTRAASLCSTHVQILQSLISVGADLNERTSSGDPVFLALATRNADIASFLARNAKEIDWTTPPLGRLAAGAIPRPPIVVLACSNGGGSAAKYLLTEAPRYQAIKQAASGPWGNPLHCVVDSTSNLDLIRFLLSAGFDPNAKDGGGKTPLHHYSNLEIVNLMLSRGVAVNAQDNEGMTPLHYAKSDEQITSLVAHGADVNIADKQGRTPIFGVSPASKTALLIKHGAKLDARDKSGKTPLLFRLSKENGGLSREELVKFVTQGADVRAQDQTGATALHYAAQHSPTQIISTLLEFDAASFNIADATGRTPLHYAANNVYVGLADLLVMHGASPSAQDIDGNTPLHLGVMQGNRRFVEELVKRGAVPTIKNRLGKTAADVISNEKPWASEIRQSLLGA